jgi:hypothetical protein
MQHGYRRQRLARARERGRENRDGGAVQRKQVMMTVAAIVVLIVIAVVGVYLGNRGAVKDRAFVDGASPGVSEVPR